MIFKILSQFLIKNNLYNPLIIIPFVYFLNQISIFFYILNQINEVADGYVALSPSQYSEQYLLI